MKEIIVDGKSIAEIIPIILILLFTLYTKPMVLFSQSSLGRFLAILLIIGYTMFDVLYGVIMCMMVILFYQLDYVEGMTSMHVHEGYETFDKLKPKSNVVAESKPFGDFLGDDMLNHPTENQQNNIDNVSMVNLNDNDMSLHQEGMTTYHDFQAAHCQSGQLKYKEFPIKTEMAQHVFPEIKYTNGLCNPCDPNCQFSIVGNKITTEEALVKPKSSNDSFYAVWNDIVDKAGDFLPAIGMHSEPFSQFMQ